MIYHYIFCFFIICNINIYVLSLVLFRSCLLCTYILRDFLQFNIYIHIVHIQSHHPLPKKQQNHLGTWKAGKIGFFGVFVFVLCCGKITTTPAEVTPNGCFVREILAKMPGKFRLRIYCHLPRFYVGDLCLWDLVMISQRLDVFLFSIEGFSILNDL